MKQPLDTPLQAGNAEGDAGPVRRGPLILVADHSPASREAISAALNAAGYRTLAAESANAALMMLGSEQPGLLLAEQDAPGLSGLDLLRELRSTFGNAALPVILMTASSSPRLAVAALNAGADDHIVKPCDGAVLAARVERQLDRAREAAALRQAASALDARLVRRTLELEELEHRIETLLAEKAALGALLASRKGSGSQRLVKSIAAI